MFRSPVGRVVLLVVMALVASSGCKPRKKELKRYAWVDAKLGGPDSPVTCTSALKGASVSLDFEALPVGSVINIRGKDYPGTGTLHVDIDVGDLIGSLPAHDFVTPGYKFDPKIPIVMNLPDATYPTAVPAITDPTVYFKDVAGKVVKLGDDPPHTPTPGNPSMIWFGSLTQLYGTAATVRDVDWVAAENNDPKSIQGPICHYRDPKTGATSSAPLTILATEVVIYDRRTAKVIDHKEFYPPPSCPLEKDKADQSVATGVSDDTKSTWVKARRTKK